MSPVHVTLKAGVTKAERNYSQIDNDVLALVWGVKKFHLYLFGCNFTLVTDHEPLTSNCQSKESYTSNDSCSLATLRIVPSSIQVQH